MTPILLTLVAAIALAPWGAAATPATQADAVQVAKQDAAIDTTRAVLADARTAAQSYMRIKLGHVRRLDHRRLTEHGFVPRDEVRLGVYVSHTAYCFTATNTDLPAGHQWRTASLDSRTQRATPGDACTAQAAAGGTAWICRLDGTGAKKGGR